MMSFQRLEHPFWLRGAALFAVVFGILTIISGGSVLFNATARQAAGDYVGFVVWFNFMAGFAYVAAGVGLWFQQRWSSWLSLAITGATLVVFIAFGIYLLGGGVYELRTVAAMSFRLAVWVVISAVAVKVERKFSERITGE